MDRLVATNNPVGSYGPYVAVSVAAAPSPIELEPYSVPNFNETHIPRGGKTWIVEVGSNVILE